MKLHFSLGIHDALEKIQQQMEPSESLSCVHPNDSCVAQFDQHNVVRTSNTQTNLDDSTSGSNVR